MTPALNNQTSKAKSNFNSGSRLNLESRSSSLLSLSNRFQAFDNINNDLDSDDCVNSISPKTNNEIKIAVGRTGNAKVHRTNRKFDSYAHSVKSCSLDPVSDDSFNLDSSSEELKENVNYRQGNLNLDKNRAPNNRKNVRSNSLSDCFDSSINDSFLFQLLNKIRTFYKLPNKTGIQWFSFLIELFDFVGRYNENEQ